MARVAAARGLGVEEASVFFDPQAATPADPWLLPDLEVARDTILDVCDRGGSVLVYGDYDVDGLSGTVIMLAALRQLGARVHSYVPDRIEEGFGLNLAAISAAAEDGVDLIVTVDTGSLALDEVEHARELGIDVVITDHHQPGSKLPAAAAVVNPKRPDSLYPFPELAGATVALQLAAALLGDEGPGFVEAHIDLAAVATVADVMPLVGENRRIVALGLQRMGQMLRPGIQALLQAANRVAPPTTWELAFVVAPRLNAAGRLGDTTSALRLLETGDAVEAAQLAAELERTNAARKRLQSEVTGAVLETVAASAAAGDRLLVASGEDWHPGVLGLAASAVAELHHRPAIVLTRQDDLFRGSGRSVAGFDLHRALARCEGLVLSWGGHAGAAGVKVAANQLETFSTRIKTIAAELAIATDLRSQTRIDAWVSGAEVDLELCRALDSFEPCGEANPRPTLGVTANVVKRRRVGGEGQHLQLEVEAGGRQLGAIGFGLGGVAGVLPAGLEVALAVQPEVNEFAGRQTARLRVCDIRPSAHAARARLAALYLAFQDAADAQQAPLSIDSPALMRSMRARGLEPDWAEASGGIRALVEMELLMQLQRGDKPCWVLAPKPKSRLDVYQSPAFIELAFGGF